MIHLLVSGSLLMATLGKIVAKDRFRAGWVGVLSRNNGSNDEAF